MSKLDAALDKIEHFYRHELLNQDDFYIAPSCWGFWKKCKPRMTIFDFVFSGDFNNLIAYVRNEFLEQAQALLDPVEVQNVLPFSNHGFILRVYGEVRLIRDILNVIETWGFKMREFPCFHLIREEDFEERLEASSSSFLSASSSSESDLPEPQKKLSQIQTNLFNHGVDAIKSCVDYCQERGDHNKAKGLMWILNMGSGYEEADNATIYFNLGLLTRDLQDRRDYFEKSLMENSENWEVHKHLGETLESLACFLGARQHYEYSLTINPEADSVRTLLLDLLIYLRDFKAIIKNYEDQLELTPFDSAWHLRFANFLSDHNFDLERARHHFDCAFEYGAPSGQLHYSFARFASNKCNQYSEAEAHCKLATEFESHPQYLYSYAELLHYRGHVDEALEYYDLSLYIDCDKDKFQQFERRMIDHRPERFNMIKYILHNAPEFLFKDDWYVRWNILTRAHQKQFAWLHPKIRARLQLRRDYLRVLLHECDCMLSRTSLDIIHDFLSWMGSYELKNRCEDFTSIFGYFTFHTDLMSPFRWDDA